MAKIIEADLDCPEHQRDVLSLTAAYALDPMGTGGPLHPEVFDRLIPGLKSHPTTLIFLAYVDGQPVALATCFRGFSTFAGRPWLISQILAVIPAYRGQRIGRELLAAVEEKSRYLGCCKLTLEVQENNNRARHLYEDVGFTQAVYGETTGPSLYYWKTL